MPLYDYQCTACGHVTEVRHGFDETHDAACEKCGGALKRVFNPAPIVFKGSGFYVTDSRGGSKEAGSGGSGDAGGSTSGGSTSGGSSSGGSESAA